MTPTTRSAKELMHFVVASGGNLPLAAERAGVDRKELVALITGGDTSVLSENLRAMLMLNLFDTIMQTNIAFIASLPNMSPGDTGKALAGFLATFAQLTATPTADLAGEVHDATATKQKLVTRLDQWKRNQPKQIVDAQSEAVNE